MQAVLLHVLLFSHLFRAFHVSYSDARCAKGNIIYLPKPILETPEQYVKYVQGNNDVVQVSTV